MVISVVVMAVVMLMVMVGVVKVNINREKVQRSFFLFYFVPPAEKKNVKKEREKNIGGRERKEILHLGV